MSESSSGSGAQPRDRRWRSNRLAIAARSAGVALRSVTAPATGSQLAKGSSWGERSFVADLDVHPLVATLTVLREGNQLPSAVGVARPSGAPSASSVQTMMAIAEAAFSTEAGPPPHDRIEWLRREYVDLMSRASGRGRFYFAAGALVVSITAPLLIGKLRSFRRL